MRTEPSRPPPSPHRDILTLFRSSYTRYRSICPSSMITSIILLYIRTRLFRHTTRLKPPRPTTMKQQRITRIISFIISSPKRSEKTVFLSTNMFSGIFPSTTAKAILPEKSFMTTALRMRRMKRSSEPTASSFREDGLTRRPA